MAALIATVTSLHVAALTATVTNYCLHVAALTATVTNYYLHVAAAAATFANYSLWVYPPKLLQPQNYYERTCACCSDYSHQLCLHEPAVVAIFTNNCLHVQALIATR